MESISAERAAVDGLVVAIAPPEPPPVPPAHNDDIRRLLLIILCLAMLHITGRVVPQVSQPPQQRESKAAEQKTDLKFSYWVCGLSFGGLCGLYSGRAAAENYVLLTACNAALLAVFLCGTAIWLLVSIQLHIYFAPLVSIMKYIAWVLLTVSAVLVAVLLLL